MEQDLVLPAQKTHTKQNTEAFCLGGDQKKRGKSRSTPFFKTHRLILLLFLKFLIRKAMIPLNSLGFQKKITDVKTNIIHF